MTRGEEAGFDIYVKHHWPLNKRAKKAYESLNDKEDDTLPSTVKSAKDWMCEHYFDTQMFGQVMSTKNSTRAR
ncbi:type I CRISPR-associated protein Cas7 [Neobacillus niacini]|uniref:type I CRISPR-associated protein Cas7 n=1 Tax=Neobacillus niacini TaxID=86668 RepID=UPI0030010901